MRSVSCVCVCVYKRVRQELIVASEKQDDLGVIQV